MVGLSSTMLASAQKKNNNIKGSKSQVWGSRRKVIIGRLSKIIVETQNFASTIYPMAHHSYNPPYAWKMDDMAKNWGHIAWPVGGVDEI